MWGVSVGARSWCDGLADSSPNERGDLVVLESRIGMQGGSAREHAPEPARYGVGPSVARNLSRGWRVGVPG
jgi:hypothetical protein